MKRPVTDVVLVQCKTAGPENKAKMKMYDKDILNEDFMGKNFSETLFLF